jgi:hypothetical protein
MSLPETTADRLLAVADIIDLTPDRYDQTFWFAIGDDGDPGAGTEANPPDVVGRGIKCDSVGCIAGWAVALTPRSGQNAFWRSWDVAGRHALGLTEGVSLRLFRADLPMTAEEVADVLRRLAKLPELERNLAGAKSVLTDEQYELLAPDDDAA